MWVSDSWQDLRFGVQVLKANRLFTTVAVLTLALGIGANTAIFSAMNTIVLRRLPVRDAGTLVQVRWSGTQPETVAYDGSAGFPFSVDIFKRLRAEREVFSDLVSIMGLGDDLLVRHGATMETVTGEMVSGNYFTGLGVDTVCGRPFTLADETGHQKVAVLSYQYWTRSFRRDCGAVGQTLYVKTVPYTIVGVAAKSFHGVFVTNDVWVPLGEHGPCTSPNRWCAALVGRIVPGVGETRALARLNPIFQHAAYDPSRTIDPKRKLCTLYFEPVRGIAGLREDYRQSLVLLLGIVGLVLVIACANVAMLLTARQAARQREFSIRMALGGSRARLLRQLLVEGSLLVAAGGTLGWLFALVAVDALRAWSRIDVSFQPDATVLLFTLGVSALATVVFGLTPISGIARISLVLPLRTSSAAGRQDRGTARGGQLVVAVQIALCLVLLTASGLLVRTLRNLEHIDVGFRSSGLLVFGVRPPQGFASDAAATRFWEGLLDRLRSLPGVESGAMTVARFGSGAANYTVALVDGKNLSGDNWEHAMGWTAVGPDFARVLGIRLLQGRSFGPADSASAPKAVVINQEFVRQFFRGSNPIGHHLRLWQSESIDAGEFTIVGVVASARFSGLRDQEPVAYFPVSQVREIGDMTYELRTAGEPLRILPAVSRILRDFGPDLMPLQPSTQQQEFASSISQDRLVARLAMCFGFLAIVLVATGLYGTLAYNVSRRTAEIGLRMALGATRREILAIVLRRTVATTAAGVLLGFPLAIIAGRLLRSFLYDLAPGDPLTYAVALTSIVLISGLASWIPARKAASVDPVVALRYE